MTARLPLLLVALAAAPVAFSQLVGVTWAKADAFGGDTAPTYTAAMPNGNFAVLSTVLRSGRVDAVLSCYRPNGSTVWSKTIWGTDTFTPAGVFTNGNSDIYVAGSAGPNGGRWAYASRTSASGAMVWAKRFKLSEGARNDSIVAAHLDGGSNLHMTGAARRLVSLGYDQPVYLRVNANGTKGLELFDSVPTTSSSGMAIRTNSTNRAAIAIQTGTNSRVWLVNSSATVFAKEVILMDDVTSVDITNGNDVYVGGRHYNTTLDAAPAVQKLNGTGVLQWTRWVNFPFGGNSLDTVNRLRVDTSGNIWAVGSAFNHDLDFAILKWNSSGAQLATRLLNSATTTSVDQAYNIEFGPQNDIYIAGAMENATNSGFMAIRANTNASFRWNRYLPVSGSLGLEFRSACFNPVTGQYLMATHEPSLDRMVLYSLAQPGTPASDSYSITRNTTLNGTSVLDNDTYAKDGVPVPVQNPQHGMLTLNANGTFLYKPDTGYVGLDNFTYKITKPGVADSTTTQVVIDVT